MNIIFAVNWHDFLVPQISLLEIFLRGTFIYFLLLVLFRVFKRQAGSIGLSDLLVIVLIADASQNAMSADYKSVTEGAALIGTLVLWDQFLDWLAFRVPRIERLLRPAPVLLVKDGKANRRNMRQELISQDELIGQLRQQGILDLKQVRCAFIEGDGQISIVRANDSSPPHSNKRRGEGAG
jgi:uncharacterized membrane protein YcaP (DUF421 family)